MNLRRSKFLLSAILVILPTAGVVSAEECTLGASAYAASTVDNVVAICCSKKNPKAKNNCFVAARKAISKTRGLITSDLTAEINEGITAVQNADCNLDNLDVLECTADLSTTVDEVKEVIKKRACSLKYKSDRQDKIAKFRRSIKKARKYLGAEYSATVTKQIRKLRNAKSCGEGGENKTGCNSFKSPYDGALRGYLYKPKADHSNAPVWLSPSFGGLAQVITLDGDNIENLRYTGIANGNRRHHRFSRPCNTYPNEFLIKEGSTCFEIRGNCSRHD